jgi:hypothetical protein
MEKRVAKEKDSTGNLIGKTWLFNLVLLGILCLAVIALFSEFIFSSDMLYSSDFIQGAGAHRNFYVNYVTEHGQFPVWNGYQFCGIPYIECFHGDTFYPFTVIKFWFASNIYRYFGWALVLHIFLGGITIFICARIFKRSQMASAMAAVAYMFAAYFVSLVAPGHDGKVFVTALFPLAIALIELAFTRKSFLHFTQLGLVIGLIILTPHPQLAYYALWICAAFVVFKLVFMFIDERQIGRLIRPAVLFAMAILVGLGISAVHFYGGFQYVQKYSPRADEKRGEDWAKSWSLHAEEVVSLVMPEFSGVTSPEKNTYWGRNFFKDNSEYAGVVPLLLAIVAVAMIRSRRTWFFGGVALFAVIFGLAGDTPFFHIFYNLIPNVKSTRAWSMIMFLFSFSTALLAAFGIDFIIEKSRRLKEQQKRLYILALFSLPLLVFIGGFLFSLAPQVAIGIYKGIFYGNIVPQKDAILSSYAGEIGAGFWITFLFVTATAVIAWLYSTRKLGIMVLWVIVGIALIDAFRFDVRFIDTFKQGNLFTKRPIIDYLKSLKSKFRILDITERDFPNNYLPLYGIEETTSFHGSQPRWYQSLIGGMRLTNLFNRNLMDMTNTKYLLISSGSQIKSDQLSGAGFPEAWSSNSLSLHENPSALDRAYLVHQWVVEQDEEKLRAAILSQQFDPHRQVGLFSDPGIQPSGDSLINFTDTVEIALYENDRIEIHAKSAADGILVLADNWYPAWRGFIDDEEVEVLRVNTSFRGVVLPAGEHKVEFRYISDVIKTGRLVSLLTLLFVVIVSGVYLIPTRRTS